MSFSINPTHNFLVDTPVIIEENPSTSESTSESGSEPSQTVNNETIESKNESNILSKGIVSNSGGLQVHQVSGALDDFY